MNQFMDEYLNKKNVFIFGAGNRGRECLDILLKNQINVKGIFDNDSKKYGWLNEKIEIQKPVKIENTTIIITVSGKYEELVTQLVNLGYPLESIITFEIIKLYIKEKHQEIYNFPTTLQLPITYKCNFDCVMCGMRHIAVRKDFSAKELEIILDDKLFCNIESVGINGGEPFLKNDLVECIKVLINKLQHLKNLYFITNGYFTDKIVDKLEKIKGICDEREIRVNISISIDGIGELQDFHRGKRESYNKAIQTLDIIQSDSNTYFNKLDIICTITKHNVFNLPEMVQWEEKRRLNIAYNIATENVRIDNKEKVNEFSVFSDEQARMVAEEFFYSQYLRTRNEKYFGLFLYLKDKKRYMVCPCMYNEWITLTPDSEISFCATYSKQLGSALERSAKEIVEENIRYLHNIREHKCETCSHYGYRLDAEGASQLFWDAIKNNYRQWRLWD